jgi:sirohydrochlorin ferrochelatase
MINNLAQDMTRLCGEITSGRNIRAALMSRLAETREAMQAAVTQLLARFAEARCEMARQTQAERDQFVLRVKQGVSEWRQRVAQMQEEFRDDIQGGHRAWQGATQGRPAPTVPDSSFQAKGPSDDLARKAKKKKR